MKSQKHRGFSLLEILLVITLLSILMGIVVLSVNPRNLIDEVNDNQREADALTIYQALEQYALKNDAYPPSINNMLNGSSAYICKTSTTDCNTSTQINLSSILVPAYMSKIPEYSKDSNNSGFYVVKDSNGKIGIGGVKKVDNTTFVKGLDNQSYTTNPIGILTSGLVLHLDAGNPSSYPEVGTTWYDLSGNGYNGNLEGGTEYINNNAGTLSFDGVDDGCNIDNAPNLNVEYATHEIWVKMDSPNNGVGQQIFARKNTSNGTFTMAHSTTNRLIFNFRNSNNTSLQLTLNTLPSTNWMHLVQTYDGTTASAYVNGVLDISSTTLTGALNTGGTFDIDIAKNNTNLNRLDGIVAMARIYNRALTDAEIQQNYNATKSRFGL